MSKLQTYRYIDDEKIRNKFEVTPLIEKSNLLDNYYKNTLKDFSPNEATFEYEQKRTNYDSVGKLNTHYYGRRNDKEPFQSDLFLGFTDKDPRSIHNDPLMGKYQEQMWHRKDDYKYSFKDDNDNSIPTAGISESKMQKNKKSTYTGFKDRYKNFEESNDAWTNGYSFIQSDKSKILLHDVDDTIPDLANVDDIKKRRDYVATMSLNALPKGWDSIPDHKIKIAQYSKLLKAKNLNDIDITKNKSKQINDGKFKDQDTEQQLLSQLLLLAENFKNKKLNQHNSQDIKYSNSKDDQIRKINKNREHFKNNELSTTELDDKKIKLLEALNNKIVTPKEYTVLNEILHKVSTSNNQSYLNKGNNKENKNNKFLSKNDIINEILYNSIQSNNKTFLDKGNNKEYKNKKSNIKTLLNNNSEFLYSNNDINNNKLNKNDSNYEIINYKMILPKDSNTIENIIISLDEKIQSYDKEKNNQHRRPNNQSNDALHQDDFEVDADFNESGYKDRKTGKIGTKYLFSKKEYEDNINDNSINDSGTIIMKKSHNFIKK